MINEDARVFIQGRVSAEDDKASKLILEKVRPFSDIPRELWIQFESKDDYSQKEKGLLEDLRNSQGTDTVVIYLKDVKAMKKLSAACMILGLSLFAGGCSNDQIDDHIISLQDKISDVTASDSTEQEDQEPSTEERVYIDELTGTLLDFDGTHLTISSNGETYVFDVSQTRLECKYGVVSSDQVSVIYQGQLSGTDISTIFPIKITAKYHNETPLEDRTLKGKVKSLTSNALVIVTEKGNTVTFPVTGVRQYY